MFFHNYDEMLNDVLQEFVPDFNNNNAQGFDVTDRLPSWVQLFDATIVTPFVKDEFLWAAARYVP